MQTPADDQDLTSEPVTQDWRPRIADTFTRRFAAYAMAAGAAGVAVAAMAPSAESTEGTIVFTPANIFLGGIGSSHLNIDLNHDGVTDVDFTMTNTQYQNTFSGFQRGSFWDNAVAGNAIIPRPLAKGKVIGPSGMFGSGRYRLAWGRSVNHSGHGGYSYGGPWARTPADQYLGVRFQIDGETHYGWIRMTVFAAPYEVWDNITGYAYNTLANQPLKAGAGTQYHTTESSHPASSGPATLGLLALGAAGLILWRRTN